MENSKKFKKEKVLHVKLQLKLYVKMSGSIFDYQSSDVSNIKQIAAYEGLPYQTLIASVLHKYAAGHLNLPD